MAGSLKGSAGRVYFCPKDVSPRPGRLSGSWCSGPGSDVGVDWSGEQIVVGICRPAAALLLRLLLEALRLRLRLAFGQQHLHRHLSACWKSFQSMRERTVSPIVMLFLRQRSESNPCQAVGWHGGGLQAMPVPMSESVSTLGRGAASSARFRLLTVRLR